MLIDRSIILVQHVFLFLDQKQLQTVEVRNKSSTNT